MLALLAVFSLLLSGCGAPSAPSASPTPLAEAVSVEHQPHPFGDMEYVRPDLDSLDQKIADCQAMAAEADKESELLVLYDEILESPAYEDDIFITSEQALDYVDDNAMVIVVDTNKPQMTECPELLKKSKMIAVLDHHRQSSNIIENAVLSYVEPYSSSTCEMIAEVLQYLSLIHI